MTVLVVGLGGTGISVLRYLRERIARSLDCDARMVSLDMDQDRERVLRDGYATLPELFANEKDYQFIKLRRITENVRQKLLDEKQKKRVQKMYISYPDIVAEMEQEKQYPYFVCGGTGSGKITFSAALRQKVLNERREIQRNPTALDSQDVNRSLQWLRKLREEAKRNELFRVLMKRSYVDPKGRFGEVCDRERRMKWERFYPKRKLHLETCSKAVLNVLCGYSGEGMDISESGEEIRKVRKSIEAIYNRQELELKSLCRSQNARKKENRTELRIRLSKRLFDLWPETHGTVDRHRNDTKPSKERTCRKTDVRKECIHELPQKLLLTEHKTKPSVFPPKQQTTGGNGQISIIPAA